MQETGGLKDTVRPTRVGRWMAGIGRMTGIMLWGVLYAIQCTTPLAGIRPPFPGDTLFTFDVEGSGSPQRWDRTRVYESVPTPSCADDSVRVRNVRRTYAPRTLSLTLTFPRPILDDPVDRSSKIQIFQFYAGAVDMFGDLQDSLPLRPEMAPVPILGVSLGYQVSLRNQFRMDSVSSPPLPVYVTLGETIYLLPSSSRPYRFSFWIVPALRITSSLAIEATLFPRSLWIRYRDASHRFHLYAGIEDLTHLILPYPTTLDPAELIRKFGYMWEPQVDTVIPGLPYRVVVGLETHP